MQIRWTDVYEVLMESGIIHRVLAYDREHAKEIVEGNNVHGVDYAQAYRTANYLKWVAY